MTREEKQKLYAALSAPFPEEAIERTDGRVTGKGYSTTGIKYQYVADRMNEVLGVGGYRAHRTITVKETATAKGRSAYEAICEIRLELGEWLDGRFVVFAEALGDGGHTAITEADARKGAFSSAFKKSAAFLGPGHEAYRGTIDDDHVSSDEPRVDRSNLQPESTSRQASRTVSAMSSARTPNPDPPVPSARLSDVPPRIRLTSKQVQTSWSLAGQRGFDQNAFRRRVLDRYGKQIEFLTKADASELISTLLARGPATANGEGDAHNPEPGRQPGCTGSA